jgi:hypothetical protein
MDSGLTRTYSFLIPPFDTMETGESRLLTRWIQVPRTHFGFHPAYRYDRIRSIPSFNTMDSGLSRTTSGALMPFDTMDTGLSYVLTRWIRETRIQFWFNPAFRYYWDGWIPSFKWIDSGLSRTHFWYPPVVRHNGDGSIPSFNSMDSGLS